MTWLGRVLIFGYVLLALGFGIFDDAELVWRVALFFLAGIYLAGGLKAELDARRSHAHSE